MKLEGEIDSIDGLMVLHEAEWSGLFFRVFEPPTAPPSFKVPMQLERAPMRFVRVAVPAFMQGEIPAFKPGDRVRVTVEKIEK